MAEGEYEWSDLQENYTLLLQRSFADEDSGWKGYGPFSHRLKTGSRNRHIVRYSGDSGEAKLGLSAHPSNGDDLYYVLEALAHGATLQSAVEEFLGVDKGSTSWEEEREAGKLTGILEDRRLEEEDREYLNELLDNEMRMEVQKIDGEL